MFVENRVCIVTVRAEDSAQIGGEIFVEREFHAATPTGVVTMRSRESSAA